MEILINKEKVMEQGSLLEGMSSGSFKRIIMARIPIGVDLLEAIREMVKRENIQKGLILMGIGALSKATFRNVKVYPAEYPITAKDRIYFEVEAPLELVSLGGYIVPSLSGQPHIHAHFPLPRWWAKESPRMEGTSKRVRSLM
jgi:predicted DNA-binding protein with PD1-like motif